MKRGKCAILESRDGAVVRALSVNVALVRFRPGAMSLLMVLALLHGFFSELSGFPPFAKINNSKFKFDQD